MARKTTSRSSANAQSKKKSSSGSARSNGAARAQSPAEKKAKKAAAAAPEADERIFDDRARRDIAGVAVCVFGVALFVCAILPADGVVSSALSTGLHLALGIGAYLLPFVLVFVGISFLIRTEQRFSLRLALGLLLIFVAVLSLLALFTPESGAKPADWLFAHDTLVARGGYLGAGVAWAGLTLLGRPVSCVILIGLILIGLAVTGLSVSVVVDMVNKRREEREERLSVEPAPPSAKPRRGRADGGEEARSDIGSQATQALPQEGIGSQKTKALPRTDDSATAQPTQVLPKAQESAKTRRLKKIKDEQSAVDAASAAEEADEVASGRRDPHAVAGAETITRKLGHAAAEEKQSPSGKSKRSKAKKTSSATPLAEPRPDGDFVLPPMSLINSSKRAKGDYASEGELSETAACLQETLEDFGIMAQVVGWVAGPTVTLFKIDLPAGVRVSRVTALTDDIALALAAPGVRIFAPVPGTNYVGIEVPNRARHTVLLGDVLCDAKPGPLQIAIGKDVEGNSIVSDLARMPHLLIGGTTGSGKSVAINAMIMSILMRATPAEVRFIMIDPKRVEFTPYNGIPHLYVPVVTEPREAASALSWGVAEMERRLKVFSQAGARNIGQYNAKVQAEIAAQRAAEEAGEEPPAGELAAELPYIVIIIDELADLMMNVGKEVEFSISRIAQLARAAGIHLIVATQRPSTNVVTGLIKANITNRIAFNVASGIDSRVILDTAGAENLIGLGDLLFSKPEYAKPQRIQGCFVSEDEINAVVAFLKEQAQPEYHSEILQTNLITLGASAPDGSGGTSASDDPLLWEAADIVVSSGLGSTSNIQRRLKVGYSRAGRIMDQLEEKGVVGPPNGSKPRDVLVDELELESLKAFEVHDEMDA